MLTSSLPSIQFGKLRFDEANAKNVLGDKRAALLKQSLHKLEMPLTQDAGSDVGGGFRTSLVLEGPSAVQTLENVYGLDVRVTTSKKDVEGDLMGNVTLELVRPKAEPTAANEAAKVSLIPVEGTKVEVLAKNLTETSAVKMFNQALKGFTLPLSELTDTLWKKFYKNETV